ncbi:MAG: ABC transporter permease [Sodalis sp. (in: enterobacteria)]
MLWRMLRQSWAHHLRRKKLAVLTVFLASSLISALLAVTINIGDKMSLEMKSYGSNILIEPPEGVGLPAVIGEKINSLSSQYFLNEAEMPNIKNIFWRNNIIGFAPMLSGDVKVGNQNVRMLGTFFSQSVEIPDEEGYQTGQCIVSPYWKVRGDWPQEISGDMLPQSLIGQALARRTGWKVGDNISLSVDGKIHKVSLSGILSSGGEEDDQLVMPLGVVQSFLGLSGKVQSIRVSALTVPENALSRRARKNLDALSAEEYDLWYCTAYVSSIAHQLQEVIPGSEVRPVWQIVASEGLVIEKIQLLMAVVTLTALAAVMGIASMMTSIIMERAREIGLMKALGARQWQILLLFYLEAATSGLIGGSIGCFAGWGQAQAISLMLFESPLNFSWIVVPCVLLIAVLIALIGTWFPAHRIVCLYPVEALHAFR